MTFIFSESFSGIRNHLLESEDHECPHCHETDVSPDKLIANKHLRSAVRNFTNDTGYTKIPKRPVVNQQKRSPPPPPPPRIQPVPEKPQSIPTYQRSIPTYQMKNNTHYDSFVHNSQRPYFKSQPTSLSPRKPMAANDITVTKIEPPRLHKPLPTVDLSKRYVPFHFWQSSSFSLLIIGKIILLIYYKFKFVKCFLLCLNNSVIGYIIIIRHVPIFAIFVSVLHDEITYRWIQIYMYKWLYKTNCLACEQSL